MVTRQILEDFARRNPPLVIHPERDIDAFVDMLNQRGGHCPCDEDRICPCPQAPNEARNQMNKKEKCCTCHFYVTPEYVAAWELSERPPEEQKKSTWKIQTDKIKDLTAVIDKVEDLIEENDPSMAAKVLDSKSNSSDCGMCKQLLGTEVLRMKYLGEICKSDGGVCDRETESAMIRMEEIKDLLKQVDEYAITGKIGGKTVEPDEEEQVQDKFHSCMSTLAGMEDDPQALPEWNNRAKLYIKSKICSGRAEDFEDGLIQCREEHGDWFPPRQET
jgi:hypothetical protein